MEKYVYNYHVHLFSNFPHLGKLDTFELYRIDTSQGDTLTREVILKLPISNGYTPYMHSFAHTPNYIVFFRFPLMWDIMKIPFAVNILPAMVWKPDDQTLVHVIDLKTQQIVQNYTMDPFFAYHHINAFENKNGDVVVDITTVPPTPIKFDPSPYNLCAVTIPTARVAVLLESTADTFVVPMPTFDVVLIPALFELHAMNDSNLGAGAQNPAGGVKQEVKVEDVKVKREHFDAVGLHNNL